MKKAAPNLIGQARWDCYQRQVEVLRDFHLQSWATFTLGHDFDTDPRFPWAAEILLKERNAEVKINTLHQLAGQHLKTNTQSSQW